VKSLSRRGSSAVLALRRAVRAQEELMEANAGVDWSRGRNEQVWRAAVRLRAATRNAERLVERFADEMERPR
jgi:hypothetical protein